MGNLNVSGSIKSLKSAFLAYFNIMTPGHQDVVGSSRMGTKGNLYMQKSYSSLVTIHLRAIHHNDNKL